jgi:hypothetical protein
MSGEKLSFDLTTKEGVDMAAKFLPYLTSQFALLHGAIKGIGWIVDRFTDTTATAKAQTDAAVEIVKAGKESGAESVELTMDQAAGIDFGSKMHGADIKARLGKSGKMKIKIVYKN